MNGLDLYAIAEGMYDEGLRGCDRLHIKRNHPSLSWSSVDTICLFLDGMERVYGGARMHAVFQEGRTYLTSNGDQPYRVVSRTKDRITLADADGREMTCAIRRISPSSEDEIVTISAWDCLTPFREVKED